MKLPEAIATAVPVSPAMVPGPLLTSWSNVSLPIVSVTICATAYFLCCYHRAHGTDGRAAHASVHCDATSCPGIHARFFYWNRQERDHATAHARNRQASACRRHRAGLGMIGTRTAMILKALVRAARAAGVREGAFPSNGKTALAKTKPPRTSGAQKSKGRLRLVQGAGRHGIGL
jgi:hypothetical protein